jgi:hypothetical protein
MPNGSPASAATVMPETNPDTPLGQALAFTVRTGRRVFFIAATAKTPLAGTHGHLDASADVDAIVAMSPDGKRCRYAWRPDPDELVIDTDPQNGYVEGSIDLPATETYGPTPHGGYHYVYARNGYDVHSDADVLKDVGIPGVDFKTETGWLVGYHRHSNGLLRVEAPPWVATAQTRNSPDGERFAMPEILSNGSIDIELTRAAGYLRAGGFSDGEIAAVLPVVNRRAPESTHTQADFDRIARSIGSKPAGELPGVITHGQPAAEKDDDDDPVEATQTAPAFPLEVLPPSLRRLAEEAAHAGAYNPAFVAVPGLAAIGVAIGGSTVVDVQGELWHERPIIWTAVSALTGTAKSAGQKIALRPVMAIDERLRMESKGDLNTWRVAKQAARTVEAKAELAPEPVRKLLILRNPTAEAVGTSLESNPRGLVYAPDELATFFTSFGQYKGGRGSDKETFLSLWDGGPYQVDRVNDGRNIFVRHPIVCVTGGMPPHRLELMRDDDGMLERFLTSCHPDAKLTVPADEQVDPATIVAWDNLINRLHRLRYREGDEPTIVPLAGAARERWRTAIAAINARYESGAIPERLRGLCGKAGRHLARLALELHCAWRAEEKFDPSVIRVEDVDRAAVIFDYFVAHAAAIYVGAENLVGTMATRGLDAAVDRAALLVRSRGGSMRRRDLQNSRRGWRTAAEFASVLRRGVESRVWVEETGEVETAVGKRQAHLVRLV